MCGVSAQADKLPWGEDVQPLKPPFDLVLAADVVSIEMSRLSSSPTRPLSDTNASAYFIGALSKFWPLKHSAESGL